MGIYKRFITRLVAFSIFGLVFLSSLPVHARQVTVIDGVSYPANSPEAWLLKLRDGLNNLNYTASLVVVQPNSPANPYLWRHGIVDGVAMEQLTRLNGPGSEVFRFGNKLSYFSPNSIPFSLRSRFINGPIPTQFFDDPLELKQGYDFILVGRSRVAGKAAQQIRIVSKDGSRYGTTVWLDQETGLLLKMDTLDATGKLVEQLQVTSLQVTEQPDAYFASVDTSKFPDLADNLRDREINFTWQLNYIPTGMHIIKKDIHRLAGSNEVVQYLMLSDGLVDVSVYISKAGNASDKGGWLKHQSNTLLSVSNGKIDVTVVGKIPPQTANAIASSIGPISQG